jgi:RNA polymerase sigma-70 factor (ECF subfamily)
MTVALDDDLMKRAALGDSEAIATLYDRYAAALLGVAIRVLGTRSEGEDVLHDVFVSLPQRARYYTAERGAVIAWLAILVRNASIDRQRRRGRAAQLGLRAEARPAEEAPDPERSAVATSAREQVRRALAALPAAQRASLEAAFFEGLTYTEIAEREGLPLNTVKSRCARALHALREALADVGLGKADPKA